MDRFSLNFCYKDKNIAYSNISKLLHNTLLKVHRIHSPLPLCAPSYTRFHIPSPYLSGPFLHTLHTPFLYAHHPIPVFPSPYLPFKAPSYTPPYPLPLCDHPIPVFPSPHLPFKAPSFNPPYPLPFCTPSYTCFPIPSPSL